MSRWFRHYAGMMRDDKLVGAAIRAKQPVERVVWVWGAILESAAEVNDAGKYEFDAAEVAYFLRADEADICAIIDALTNAGRLSSGIVVNWSDRQFQSDRSATRQAAYRERKRARDGGCDEQVEPSDVTVTSQSRHGDAPETETDTETKAEKKTDSRSVAKATLPYASRFDEFWQAYPRRDGPNPRKPAEQRFNSLVKSGVDPQMLIDEARALCEAERKRGNIGTRFIPQAVTWLNQQRWSDHAAVAMVQLLAATATLSKKFHVKSDTPQWDAWVQHLGRAPPQDKDFGWYFDSEWPPADPKQPSTHHEGRA